MGGGACGRGANLSVSFYVGFAASNDLRRYLYLHDHDLNKALDAMEQDQEWDEKYGNILRARRERIEKQRREGGVDLSQVKVDSSLPEAIELKAMAGSSSIVTGTAVSAS